MYLAVILDRFSRKAIGWALDRALQARIAVAALRQAIELRRPPAGVVHHSDRGVQYASDEYQQVLAEHEMVPSMSRPAYPYDNANLESFMRTLKQEEIYCHQYRDFEELSAHMEKFLGVYYNTQRLHSALGYRTPEEFERDTAGTAAGYDAATIEYFCSPANLSGPAAPGPGKQDENHAPLP